jgi:hypothetical protein
MLLLAAVERACFRRSCLKAQAKGLLDKDYKCSPIFVDQAFSPAHLSDPADQQFTLVYDLGRQVIVEIDEQLFVADHFGAPGFVVEGL